MEALSAFGTATHRWLDDRHDAFAAETLSVDAGSRALLSSALADEAEETTAARQQEAADLAITLETVERSAGSEFHALDQQLISLRTKALRTGRGTRNCCRTSKPAWRAHSARWRRSARVDTSRAAEATVAHDAAEARHRHLTSGHLPADAGDVPDGPVDPRLIRDSEARLA